MRDDDVAKLAGPFGASTAVGGTVTRRQSRVPGIIYNSLIATQGIYFNDFIPSDFRDVCETSLLPGLFAAVCLLCTISMRPCILTFADAITSLLRLKQQ